MPVSDKIYTNNIKLRIVFDDVRHSLVLFLYSIDEHIKQLSIKDTTIVNVFYQLLYFLTIFFQTCIKAIDMHNMSLFPYEKILNFLFTHIYFVLMVVYKKL